MYWQYVIFCSEAGGGGGLSAGEGGVSAGGGGLAAWGGGLDVLAQSDPAPLFQTAQLSATCVCQKQG